MRIGALVRDGERIDKVGERDSVEIEYRYLDGDVYRTLAYLPGEHIEYSYWMDVSRGMYTEDIAEEMMCCLGTVAKHNGKMYMILAVGQSPSFTIKKDDFYYEELELTVDEINGTSAVVSFNYQDRTDICDASLYKTKRTSAELQYTENGWRISGGDYIELIKNEAWVAVQPVVISAPQTSLTTAVYATVAALALGVVVVKKKH